LVVRLARAADLAQRLTPALFAHWNHQATADRKLLFQCGGYFRSTCSDQNCIERRGLRPALGPIADPQRDVVITQLVETFLRLLSEGGMALDRVNLTCASAHDGRGVSRACADFENTVPGSQLCSLDHERHNVGLGDRLLLTDRQRT